MKHRRTPSRPANAGLATTASALIALVAIAAAMNSLPGTSVRAAMVETRGIPVEAASVRAVAAAVAAAARELVGTERITAALHVDRFADDAHASKSGVGFAGVESWTLLRSRPIAERLIDLPPPVC